jgi:hypothetical protein
MKKILLFLSFASIFLTTNADYYQDNFDIYFNVNTSLPSNTQELYKNKIDNIFLKIIDNNSLSKEYKINLLGKIYKKVRFYENQENSDKNTFIIKYLKHNLEKSYISI